MKKYFTFLFALMLSAYAFGQTQSHFPVMGILIEWQVNYDKPVIGGVPMPKSPVEPPMVTLDDHTLYLYDVAYDFTLMLVDENDDVVYSTFGPANTASVVLPSTLTGTYTLMLIPNGTYYFEGEIEL